MGTPTCLTINNQQIYVVSLPHESGKSTLGFTDPYDLLQETRDTPQANRALETPEQPYSRGPPVSPKWVSPILLKIKSESLDAPPWSPPFEKLPGDSGADLNARGITKFRDGFFDAVFFDSPR